MGSSQVDEFALAPFFFFLPSQGRNEVIPGLLRVAIFFFFFLNRSTNSRRLPALTPLPFLLKKGRVINLRETCDFFFLTLVFGRKMVLLVTLCLSLDEVRSNLPPSGSTYQ